MFSASSPLAGFLPRRFAFLLGLLCFPALNASAVHGQDLRTAGPGSKVRITAPNLGLEGVVGIVSEVRNGSLVVQFGEPRGTIPVASGEISNLEVDEGRGTRKYMGMFFGAVVGGAIGWSVYEVIPASSGINCDNMQGMLPCFSMPATEERTVRNTVPYAILGGVAGYFIGRMFKTGGWFPVNLDGAEFSVSPVVGPASRGLSLSISF